MLDTDERLNVLVSFPYMTRSLLDTMRRHRYSHRFLLDSGAFTAWKSGRSIDLDAYCRFLDSFPVRPWRYFTLDVIGNPKATLTNYQKMLRRGFTPIPIFTRGEDPSILDDYYKTSDVVGFGGLTARAKSRPYVNAIMEHVGRRRVHWLGFTNGAYVKHYRPYMCDASTWASIARLSRVAIHLGDGIVVQFSKTDFLKPPARAVRRALSRLGIDPNALSRNDSWHGARCLVRQLAARSVVDWSLWAQRNCGTLLFAAAGSRDDVELLTSEFKQWQRKR